MGLIGELEAARHYTPVKGPRCTVCKLMARLSDDDRDALNAAFASDMMTVAIREALHNEGHDVPANTLNRHRKGECRGAA